MCAFTGMQCRRIFSVLLSLIVIFSGGSGVAQETKLPFQQKRGVTPPPIAQTTSLTTDPLQNLLVISTLDGTLTALDRISGDIQWVSHDKPMIQVPMNNPPPSDPTTHQNQSKQNRWFLPDPKSGALYMMGKQNSLRKLPFTIPQLVAMAPCRNSEGLMYTGKKLDMWLSLNPYTGEKHEMPMEGNTETCPKWSVPHSSSCTPDDKKNSIKPVLIGKTEYTLSMMDGPRKWNVTYHHYSSNDMSPQGIQDYEQVHFTSPSEGHLMTYDRNGELLWQVELTSPVVGLYVIESHSTNLVSVPFNPIATDTLERLKGGESEKALSPTTYVGECAYGLYAVPTLADENVLVIGDSHLRLLEGVGGETSGEENGVLLLGYYKGESENALIGGEQEFNESKVIPAPVEPVEVPEVPPPQPQIKPTRPPTTPNVQEFPPPPVKKDSYWFPILTTSVVTLVASGSIFIIVFVMYRRYKNNQLEMQIKLLSNDNLSGSNRTIGTLTLDTGELIVGKITLYPDKVIGKGCEGTFVFKGKFEGRDVAVKRILPECFSLADREVDLLKESDQHGNVIRYFCTESDGQFRYIALELCVATLSDWVEGRWEWEGVDAVGVLKESSEGLEYLHSLRIVHRDVKPANVLLSIVGGKVKAMISDFGLCKKIRDGRGSYSRRSGGVPGTDGWIAKEVVCGDQDSCRMTYSVDIFSMGCVYYYVLTKGSHPFGDPFRRQSNIITGDYDLSEIQDNPRGAFNLIRNMISSNPNDRPPLKAILLHPLFWSNDKVLCFFLDVSDRIEKESEESFPLLGKLESKGSEIVRGDWRDHICSHVAMDLRKYRTYKGDNIRDLLRALRNKKNHYRELSVEAQGSLGNVPDGFVWYWVSRFPLLLEHVWVSFEGVKRDSVFGKYYCETYDWGDGVEFEVGGGVSVGEVVVGKGIWKSRGVEKRRVWRGRGRGSPGKAREREQVREVAGDTPSNDHNWRKRSPDGD